MAYSKSIILVVHTNPAERRTKNLPSTPRHKHDHIIYDSIFHTFNEDHQNWENANNFYYFPSNYPQNLHN
jgi:hypothetical protein